MSFCCGASMIGAVGSLRHIRTYIHEVPILYCPVCQHMEVYPKVKDEFDLLADYANSDDAPEVFFNDFVEMSDLDELFTDCIDVEGKSYVDLLKSQIDHSLDLLSVAKKFSDQEWESQLHTRLKVLSEKLRNFNKRQHQQKK